jgi:hypothetical protein
MILRNNGQDPVALTHAGEQAVTEDGKVFTRIRGGAEIRDLYISYRDNCGWWNNDCTTTFGVEEFIGMYILFESNSNTNLANILVTIFAQNLYVGGNNPAACSVGGVCANGAFNFIAANIDGSSGLLKGPLNDSIKIYDRNTPKLGSAADIRNLISRFGRSALNSNSVVLWDRKNGPSKWGNIQGADDIRKNLTQNKIQFGTDSNTVYHLTGNAVYLSVNQYNYWDALGVNMTLAIPGGK